MQKTRVHVCTHMYLHINTQTNMVNKDRKTGGSRVEKPEEQINFIFKVR